MSLKICLFFISLFISSSIWAIPCIRTLLELKNQQRYHTLSHRLLRHYFENHYNNQNLPAHITNIYRRLYNGILDYATSRLQQLNEEQLVRFQVTIDESLDAFHRDDHFSHQFGRASFYHQENGLQHLMWVNDHTSTGPLYLITLLHELVHIFDFVEGVSIANLTPDANALYQEARAFREEFRLIDALVNDDDYIALSNFHSVSFSESERNFIARIWTDGIIPSLHEFNDVVLPQYTGLDEYADLIEGIRRKYYFLEGLDKLDRVGQLNEMGYVFEHIRQYPEYEQGAPLLRYWMRESSENPEFNPLTFILPEGL